jgi:hypothetical protein
MGALRLASVTLRLAESNAESALEVQLVQRGGNMQVVLFVTSPRKTTCSPATVLAEGAQFNGRPSPATVSAEGAQFNGRPSPATVSAEGAQFNGRPSPAPNWRGNCGTQY